VVHHYFLSLRGKKKTKLLLLRTTTVLLSPAVSTISYLTNGRTTEEIPHVMNHGKETVTVERVVLSFSKKPHPPKSF
jgi:hypothetical protein